MLNSSGSSSAAVSLSLLRERMAEIKQQVQLLRAISNSSETPLTSVAAVTSAMRRDLSTNVLTHLSGYSSGSEGHSLRCEAQRLDRDILAFYEEAEQARQALDSSPRLTLNAAALPSPPALPAIPSVYTPSPLMLTMWQSQMARLVRGENIYPRALNSMGNTCAEQALCTASFIFNEQAHVDLTKLQKHNEQVDLMEMVQTLNPAVMPSILTGFDAQNMARLQQSDVYIARMGENGGNGHNAIWFCWNGDWYQSASTSTPVMKLTSKGQITPQAAGYFKTNSRGLDWGYGMNQYSITVTGLLPGMPSVLCSLVSELRQTP